jgi:hypothetical protein
MALVDSTHAPRTENRYDGKSSLRLSREAEVHYRYLTETRERILVDPI